jgi:crotonobetainyl-CoA:carnitine CoA-transferase CaiB-like acyl-CoA transferase
MTEGPLAGVRILDLTQVWAGPLAVRILADLGATVVKLEAPLGRGPRNPDEVPIAGWIGGAHGDEPWNRNAAFVKLMRNRQSLCLDLKTELGKETFRALAAHADVVIENFRAGVMAELGLAARSLRALNPRLICVSLAGYGDGPYRDRVAFGPTVEPLSGLAAALGYGPGDTRCSALALPDPMAALAAAAAVVTALREREATGAGLTVEVTLQEAAVTGSGPWLLERQLGGLVTPMGNRHPQMAPHGVYPCSGTDAWVALACTDDSEWRALCALLDVGLDQQMSLASRMREHSRIDAAIAAWTRRFDKHAAALHLQRAGIPAGPVNSTPDMLADDQVQTRGFFAPLEAGTPVPGNPIRMAGLSSADWTPCPRLGADNATVLADWLGYRPEQIAELEQLQILIDRPPP